MRFSINRSRQQCNCSEGSAPTHTHAVAAKCTQSTRSGKYTQRQWPLVAGCWISLLTGHQYPEQGIFTSSCLFHSFLGWYGNPGRQHVSGPVVDRYSATSTLPKPHYLQGFRLGSEQEAALSRCKEKCSAYAA